MRWLSVAFVAVALHGCDSCSDEVAPPAADGAAVAPRAGFGSSAADGVAAGTVYKEAHERAKAEITPDNASDRLREIERSIDREVGIQR